MSIMRADCEPTPTCFLVRNIAAKPLDLPRLRKLLLKIGWVEEIEGRPEIAVVHPELPSKDPRQVWGKVQAVADSGHAVYPALEGPDGSLRYPTGAIQVRFIERLGDSEIESFAQEHGLDWCGRNQFVPTQSTFRPVDPEASYLPDLFDRLQVASGVKATWLETLTRYRREQAEPRASAATSA